MKPDAVENHPIWEDSDVEVWLQDVVEASNLFIPGERKCDCIEVFLCDRWFVRIYILMCDSAPKESIRHPHLWSVGHCQVFYPIWGKAFWIYDYSFDILIFGEQLYKMSSISSLSMSSVLNDISFVLWLKQSVSRHKLLLTLALQQIYPFVIDRGNFHTFDYFER